MSKKIIIGIIIAILLGAFTLIGLRQKSSYEPQQNLNAPIEIPSKDIVKIKDVADKEKPMVVMFYVDWCGYCRRFMPKFGNYAEQYKDKYTFAVVNSDDADNKQMVEDFHIIAFPALFIVDNKINHKFSLHPAATIENEVMEEELNNYIKVREKILVK